ncbi:MAG TPA: UDP-3-O-[3-hydroxymyristoyl] N-acetylglucosamine deacetylase [Cyanobacteria bacterium UBA8156]|nr:UDP-3-O-[3-hydroxymyristoyl] N-acetylglucosamine deacetylase [Cyanobacteria bacterium UBA8156]
MARTLAAPVTVAGTSLHGGQPVTVTLEPAPAGQGRVFRQGETWIPADLTAALGARLSTELSQGGATVRTVEHLLAALAGLGIDNATVTIEGDELPILDGSARPWVVAIAQVGTVVQGERQPPPPLREPVTVQQGDSFVSAVPSDRLQFTYGIDFPTAAIGRQWRTWCPDTEPFAEAIAPARTFTLQKFIEPLRAAGLIAGGSLENAIVCDDEQWLNPPLRFADEPCRHKLLDLVGDLSLLGPLPPVHVVAYKASHVLHVELARALATRLQT